MRHNEIMTAAAPYPLVVPEGTRPVGVGPCLPPGSIVRWRFRRLDFPQVGGEVVQPMRVVRDDEAGLVLWLAGGTPTAENRLVGFEDVDPHDVPDAARFMPPERASARVQVPGSWYGDGVLRIVPAGMPFSVWVFGGGAAPFRGWYVNLEHPHRRLDAELFTSDHILDLTISPTGRVRCKDADELAAALEHGQWTADIVAAIEAGAERAEREYAAGHWAFDEEWTHWSSDAGWSTPGPEHVAEFLSGQ